MTPEHIEKMNALIKSGYAGVLSNGNIVDRREYPEAIPVQKNSLLGVPEPKELKPQSDFLRRILEDEAKGL